MASPRALPPREDPSFPVLRATWPPPSQLPLQPTVPAQPHLEPTVEQGQDEAIQKQDGVQDVAELRLSQGRWGTGGTQGVGASGGCSREGLLGPLRSLVSQIPAPSPHGRALTGTGVEEPLPSAPWAPQAPRSTSQPSRDSSEFTRRRSKPQPGAVGGGRGGDKFQ